MTIFIVICIAITVIAVEKLIFPSSENSPDIKNHYSWENDFINNPMKAWHPLNRFNSSRDERGW